MTDARTFTSSLGGRWHGSYGVASCPVCQPEGRRDQAALSIADGGKLLLRCFKSACDFRDVLAAAGVAPGTFAAPDPAAATRREAERQVDLAKRARQAERIWQEARPIGGTAAETYLRGRAITCPLPDTLRFHPDCWHAATARRLPALVALVEGSDTFAVHRTYLRPDGSGKAAVEPDKAMLGLTAGGAVRLSGGPGRLVVAEGIETALSLGCGLLDGPMTLWSALSTSGLRGLRLPRRADHLVIAPDGEAAGREAAHALAERAHALGWAVSLLTPPEGGDFNDILTGKAAA